MRIVITNVVALNVGDAAILLGILKVLRQGFDRFELVVLDSQAKIAARLYPELRFEQLATRPKRRGAIGKLGRMIVDNAGKARRLLPGYRDNDAEYARADLIVSTGGTYLVEHYDLRDRVYQFALATAAKAPLILYTQSLGPYRKPHLVAWMKRLMPDVDLALLRDERSAGNLRAIGALPKTMEVVADAAFALAEPERLEAARARRVAGRPRIAVSVRSWKHFREGSADEKGRGYFAAVAASVERLVRERGAHVTFLSTCQGVPEYWTDDSKAARQIVELIAPDVRGQVEVNADFHRPERLMEVLAGFDMVVATRMHMAILSLCAGTPVFPIAYEFKTSELFANLGFGDRVVDIEDADPATLPERILSLLDDLDAVRGPLFDAVLGQYRSAMAVADKLRRIL